MSGLGTRAAEPRRIFRAIAEAQAAHATALAAAAGTARAMILAEQRARAELMEAGACTAATYLAGPDLYAEARLLAQFAVLHGAPNKYSGNWLEAEATAGPADSLASETAAEYESSGPEENDGQP